MENVPTFEAHFEGSKHKAVQKVHEVLGSNNRKNPTINDCYIPFSWFLKEKTHKNY